MDRFWLLTWTTYGTWLPGDRRGFVGRFDDDEGKSVLLNVPGTDYASDKPALAAYARQRMKGPAILLDRARAECLQTQLIETATFHRRTILAGAIMANHVHLVVGVPGDPDPAKLLNEFKSYGSRALNRAFGTPPSGTWWTASGSRRKLPDIGSVERASEYVWRQEYPLLVWLSEPRTPGEPGP